MPWVKFSDDWYDDIELVEAGPAAMLAWVTGISWCARNLTDGRLPAGQIPRLADWSALGTTAEQVIAPLVASGRLQTIEGGYQIVNYLIFQPSKEAVLADREAARARAAKSRGGAAHVQRTSERSAGLPVPVPDTSSSLTPSVTETGLPPDLWTSLAGKQMAAAVARGVSVASPAAWKAKAARNAQDQHHERAVGLVANYTLTTSQLVDVLLTESNPPWLTGLRKKEAS